MYIPKLGVVTSAGALVLLSRIIFTSAQFNPRDYIKQVATCETLTRVPESQPIELSLRYVNINTRAKNSILMVHGWPSLWSTWSNQIIEFKRDYHLIIPDLRGFGESTHPGDPRTSGSMGDLVGDLVCILQHANVNSAICMGHDWGAQVCYEAARMRPDLFEAVIGVAVPYIPAAGPFVPAKHFVAALPKLAYQLYFDGQLQAAAAELDQDVRRTIRATLRTVASAPPDEFLKSQDSFLDAWRDLEEIPPVPFFSHEEEDYFVEQYKIQGFKNTLQFYMTENRRASHEFSHSQGNHSIPLPVLAVYPLNDPVADWILASRLLKSADFIPRLTTEVMEGAHWFHIENPEKFNRIIRKWLRDVDLEGNVSRADTSDKAGTRMTDEL